MDRRQFIKNTAICSCALCLGCNKSFSKLHSNFLYKSTSNLPKNIQLDASSICQLSCPECWRNTCSTANKLGFLEFKNFKNLVDNYKIEKVELSNKGEIFLNPELDKIIEYSYEKGIKLSAWNGVNGNYISDKVAELMVKTEFLGFQLSIDGATNDVYKIYRVGGDINKVFENVNKINFYKKKHKSDYPFMTYKFIVFGHNEHEIPLAKELFPKYGFANIKFVTNYAPDYSPVKNKKFVKEQTGLNFDDLQDQYISDREEKKTNWFPCKTLWDYPAIAYDGALLGCCATNHNNCFSNVNVFKDGYLKAMNCEDIRYAKKMLVYKAKEKDNIPCTSCYLYKKLKKSNITLTEEDINGQTPIY